MNVPQSLNILPWLQERSQKLRYVHRDTSTSTVPSYFLSARLFRTSQLKIRVMLTSEVTI
jgi:hypothetical protein